MQELPLLAVPNQSFDVDLEGRQWSVTIREANGVMVADVVRDAATIIQGTRLLPGEPVIPYAYLQAGNLVFQTQDDALPYWDQFGVTQALFYLTDAEMA